MKPCPAVLDGFIHCLDGLTAPLAAAGPDFLMFEAALERQAASALDWLAGLPWPWLDQGISAFVFYYPLFMAYAWMIGAGIFYLRWERPQHRAGRRVPDLPQQPPVSILIPCYNEGATLRETLGYLRRLDYPQYEIIAINDGSRDNTLDILEELALDFPALRVLNLASNQGKAVALRTAALLANSEYLICIDGDALLDPDAIPWLLRHFLDDPRVGAVTGNPRIRTRSTLLGKLQVGEFSAIIGLIKRAQRVYGRIFTVSGVIAAFRRSALHRVGYWSPDMVTEDIDISWKLQLDGWQLRYEPRALCWVLMPETLAGLWRQRVRWAQGGAEVLLRYGRSVWRWSARRLWPIYLECLAGYVWAHLMVLALLGWALHPSRDFWDALVPDWTGMLLSVTCLAQFAVSMAIDARYEAHGNGQPGRYYYWMIWYPLAYWLINVGTTVAGMARALRKRRGQRAVWVTLDRGVFKRDD
ncbi:poly-beta-1,6-N-acetyl-D-glucosamine synthase [Methylomagnum ishizawai]|uniref:poly-beta-1,6-N-acetyl-D-glucosamine synthase n=1 Tax=Methylomagnum ishizawai TaxID=1760988 RepID=UPI001C327261|nr:poly-beta-1,6-N-acetyl-D-glucosamine synthase [Methylomagnum ishizawai]BBL76158.1 poly-beta-1,6 N-acetyl-D-glucosamine synthase [Methylomagnum ishizawai]